MEIQVLDPEYQYYKKDVPEPHDDLEIHKESREEPEPGQSKRKRVDSLRGRIKMLKIIKWFKGGKTWENTILARQRVNKEALNKVIEDEELLEDYNM